jgi:EmrB/QacA subfamily drug resistance transporter
MRRTFAITALALFMFSLDRTVVLTALPDIGADLGAGLSGLQWVLNAYTLTFAVLVVTGAALGDRFGRRRMLVVGLALFTLGSGLAAVSSSIGWLVFARAVQGVGGSLLTPLTLTLLVAAVPASRRGRVLGAWGGIAGVAAAFGPVVGGALAGSVGWQAIFWLNVPIGLVLMPLASRWLAESRGPHAALDLVGVVLATGALFAFVWGVVESSSSCVGLGVVGLAAFVWWESRAPAPMLPLRFFASRTFAVASGASLLGYGAIFGSLFLLSSLMQVRFGYGAFESGLRLLPWAGVPMLVVPLGGWLTDRFGARAMIVFGLACAGVALAWLARGGSYWTLVPAMVLGGIGGASLFAPITSAALGAVAPAEQGQASGATVAIRELAVVLGVAIAGSVFAAHGSFGSPDAFASGFRAAVGLMAVVAFAGAVLALKLRPAADAELAVDVAEVPLDGLGADAQLGRDLAVAPAGGGQLGHAPLGGREAVAGSGA